MVNETEDLMENGIPFSMYKQLITNVDRRGKLVDAFFKDGTPTDNRDIRVAKEVMESQDASILAIGKLNKDAQANNNAVADIAAEVIRQVTQAKQQSQINTDIEIPEEYIPTDIIDGEMAKGIIHKDYSDIIKQDE